MTPTYFVLPGTLLVTYECVADGVRSVRWPTRQHSTAEMSDYGCALHTKHGTTLIPWSQIRQVEVHYPGGRILPGYFGDENP